MDNWQKQRVLTLGSLRGALAGPIEPNHAAWFFHPPPTTPQSPQNLLRPTLQNGPSLVDHSMSLGAIRRLVPSSELGPPANPRGTGDIYVSSGFTPTWFDYYVRPVAAATAAYHGYVRNQSIGWSLVWALSGGLFPLITNAIGIAQGFDKRKR